MDAFERVKHISQSDKDLTLGYIGRAQVLLPNVDNPYYNIPEIVGILTMLYCHLAEYFEFHDNLKISDDKKMITYNQVDDDAPLGVAYGNIRINKATTWERCEWEFELDVTEESTRIDFGLFNQIIKRVRVTLTVTRAHIVHLRCQDLIIR